MVRFSFTARTLVDKFLKIVVMKNLQYTITKPDKKTWIVNVDIDKTDPNHKSLKFFLDGGKALD